MVESDLVRVSRKFRVVFIAEGVLRKELEDSDSFYEQDK